VETFVVRIATPAPGAKDPEPRELHGVVEQLRSKRTYAFRGSDELLRLLRSNTTSTRDDDG
jgi:hypothetical protein